MTEHCSIAAGEHGGVASPVVAEARVSHCVDPTVDASQTAGLEGARDMAL
jgi:hypothetical protein